MVVVRTASDGGDHVVEVERPAPGPSSRDAEHEVGSAYLPGLSRGDFAGMVVGIVGTIVVVVLAAATAAGAETTRRAGRRWRS